MPSPERRDEPERPDGPERREDIDPDDVDAVVRAARVFAAVTAESIAQAGASVTLPQLRALVLVAEAGRLSTSAVAAALDIHLSNASRLCDRLVQANLLQRREDPVDRRRSELSVTPAATDLLARVNDHRRVAFAEILTAVPAADRAGVSSALTAFADAGAGRSRDGTVVLP